MVLFCWSQSPLWRRRHRSNAAEKAPLAIKGYDPVAYFTDGKPRRGLPEIEYEWDEHRYRFARPEHRELFKADPVRYAPQFANFCAMSLAQSEIVEANPEYWLISDGKLYIFGKSVGPELFQKNSLKTWRGPIRTASLFPSIKAGSTAFSPFGVNAGLASANFGAFSAFPSASLVTSASP